MELTMSVLADPAVADREEVTMPQATGQRKREGGSPLERVTVNLIARASDALRRLSDRTGDSRTDNINRAIQIYEYLDDITSRGGAIYVRESKDSELQLVKML
jgi:hypothetical protein